MPNRHVPTQPAPRACRLRRVCVAFLLLSPPALLGFAAASARTPAGEMLVGAAAGAVCLAALGLSNAMSRVVR